MTKEEVPVWVKVVIGVALFAIAIGTTVGGVAWAMSRDSTAHGYVVDSLLKTDLRHDKLIIENAKGISDVQDEQHRAELARRDTDNKLDFVIKGMDDIETKQDKFIEYLMQYDYDKKKDSE